MAGHPAYTTMFLTPEMSTATAIEAIQTLFHNS